MPGRFRFTQADIKSEASLNGGATLDAVQVEPKYERVIKDYEPRRIIKPGTGDYQFTRENFGPRAATDAPRNHQSRKDARFILSDLVREPLAIDVEERRAIEARIRSEVDALAKETYAAAREAGFEEGRKEGHEAAMAEAREQAASVLDSFSQMVESVESHRARLLETQERFLMELVLKIARKVCLKEIQTDPQYIHRLIATMVEQSGARENLRIRVSVADFESVSTFRSTLSERFGGLKNLTIEASSSVEPGQCEVETDLASYTASLDSQLEIIEKAVLGETA